MITDIEKALVARLKAGLGEMITEATTYAGELDDDPGRIIRKLPAAWVTFGGIVKTEAYSTSRQKYIATGRFVVVVGDYSSRSEEATRQGGPDYREIGTYLLVDSVRRLISGQDLGMKIDLFRPGRVRTLFNTRTEQKSYSVFACEFDTRWPETVLENGKWPERSGDPASLDAAFNKYKGELSDPDPDLLRVGMRYHQPQTPAQDDQEDLVELSESGENNNG